MEAGLEDDFIDLMTANNQGDSTDLDTVKFADIDKRNEVVVNQSQEKKINRTAE